MIARLKYFYDSINTVVIVAPGHEFLSAKYAQFPLYKQSFRGIL